MSIMDIIFIAVISAVLTWLTMFVGRIVWSTIFKHTFIAMRVVNGRSLVYETPARVSKDKEFWILWNKKFANRIPHPPHESIEIDSKGRMFATGFVEDWGEVFEWVQYKPSTKKIETFDVDQRASYMRELEEANKFGDKTWKDLFIQVMPMIIMGVVIVLALIFAPEVYSKHIEVIDKMNDVAQTNQETAKIYADYNERIIQAIEGRQVLDSDGVPD